MVFKTLIMLAYFSFSKVFNGDGFPLGRGGKTDKRTLLLIFNCGVNWSFVFGFNDIWPVPMFGRYRFLLLGMASSDTLL